MRVVEGGAVGAEEAVEKRRIRNERNEETNGEGKGRSLGVGETCSSSKSYFVRAIYFTRKA